MFPLKIGTALDVLVFAHDSSGDATTGIADGSFTKRISKGSGAFAALTATIVELENGWYRLPLSSAHTDTLGILTITLTASGMKQINIQFRVHTRLPDDLAYPTVTGRSLDVSAAGNAGIDWANIEAPTTAQVLSGTTVGISSAIGTGGIVAGSFAAGAIDNAALATDAIGSAELAASAVTEIQTGLATSAAQTTAQTDLDDIQLRLPAALVGGRIDASVGSMTANSLTASALASDAVTEIRSVVNGTADSGSTTTLVDSALSQADNGYWNGHLLVMTSGVLAGQARIITDFVAATDTLTVSPAFTQAVGTQTYEIWPVGQADVQAWRSVAPSVLVSGRVDSSVGAMAAGTVTAAAVATDAIDSDALAANAVTEIQSGLATSAAIAAVQADTDDIQARLPAALVGGRIDSSVGAMAAGTVTAAAVATDAIDADAIAANAVTEIQAGLATAAALATVQADTDDIQTRLPATLISGRIDSSVGAMAAGTVTATAIATDAIDNDALAANAVTEIQSGLATSAALTTAQTDLDDIQARLPAALVSGRMDSSTGAMAAGVVTAAAVATDAIDSDALAASAISEIQAGIVGTFWDVLTSGMTTVGSIGKLIKDFLDIAVSSRATPAQVSTSMTDVWEVDTETEITAIPPAVTTRTNMLKTIYAFCTNKLTETATTQTLRNRADSATIGQASVADDSTTASRGSYS